MFEAIIIAPILDNTIQNKAKFFALYWGQEVIVDTDNSGKKQIYPVHWSNMYRFEESYLELKDPSDFKDYNILRYIIMREDFPIFYSEYMRSQGYAFWYLGLSVEKQIEYGWIKLKS